MDSEPTLLHAASISVLGKEIGYAWELVIRAMSYNMLDKEEISELVIHLKDGRDYGVDHIFFDMVSDTLEVRLHDESVHADKALMIQALEELLS